MKKCCLIIILLLSFNSFASDRIALVIGNDNYQTKPLKNSINDAKDLAATLEKLNFKVTLVTDADKSETISNLSDSSLELSDNSTNAIVAKKSINKCCILS